MANMNKEKALDILGLQEPITDEKIKSAYRKLSLKHHPDMFDKASKEVREYHEERMKDINAARDYFTKFNLDRYKLEIQEKMRSYYVNTIAGDSDLINIILNLVKTIRLLANRSEDKLIWASSKEEVDRIFNRFLEKVKDAYIIYLTSFYTDNYIEENDVKETINYNLRVGDFYKQLCHIRDKYSRKIKFETRVEQEVAKYKLYVTCTDNLWILISLHIVNKTIIEAQEHGFNNEDIVISTMHKEIESLFQFVDEINLMFKTIEQDLLEINDEALNQEYDNIKNDYNAGASLDSIKQKLISLNKKIEDYKKELARIAKMKENEPLVNSLYVHILNNYNSSLLELNPVNDNDKIQEITKLFQFVLSLFLKNSKGLIEFDKLIMMEGLKFRNLINDRELLNVVTGNGNLNNERLRIYLKKKEFCNKILDESSFFALICEDDKYYMKKIRPLLASGNEIGLDEIEKEYMPLEEVMKRAIYQGYSALYLNATTLDVLYELNVAGDYRYITINNGVINIVKQNDLSEAINFIGYDYNDKDKVRDLIEKQIEESLARNSRK